LNAGEPQPEPAIPSPPEFLSEDAKLEWERVSQQLFRLGLLSQLDRTSLAAYCQAYGRWKQAEAALAELARRDQLSHGLMIKTSNGNLIQNPLVGTANKAMAEMMKYAVEFGMTPSARSRIETSAPFNGGKFAGLLGGFDDPAEAYFVQADDRQALDAFLAANPSTQRSQ
jgi:P27 family predicted phage terminase small subunit